MSPVAWIRTHQKREARQTYALPVPESSWSPGTEELLAQILALSSHPLVLQDAVFPALAGRWI